MSKTEGKKTDESKERKSFLESLPAILTGFAALVTAIGGCIGIFLASPRIVDFFFAAQATSVAQATQTLSPTLVLPPATMPLFIPTLTILPTATSRSTPIPAPSTATPSCAAVSGVFAAAWSQVQSKIGCAQGSVISGLIAEENFQYGEIFWREPIDYAQVLVLFSKGTWKIFQHAPYVEGSPEYTCVDANTPAKSPPTPRRGFGLVWCDSSEIRSGLGNATDVERGFSGYMQHFDKGFMIRTDYNATFVFYATGGWERK